MTLSPPTAPPSGDVVGAPSPPRSGRPESRLVGPDVVRALALVGVVLMNYHGYLIIDGGERSSNFWGRLFNPWDGPFSTRFAATFVLTAGVGVTLFTRTAIGDPAAVSARRWTLIRRGLLLYGFGLIYHEIWPGAILPFYGGMFVLGAFLFGLATPIVVAVGIGAAVAGAGIAWFGTERSMDGRPANWLFSPGPRSPRGHLFDVFVNGTHPLLPWLAFFCAGIVLGRVLRSELWRPITIGVGFTLFGFATLVNGAFENPTRLTAVLTSTDPFERGLLYMASALGTALVAFALISWVAELFCRSPIVVVLAHAGQMTLTLYIVHGLVFNFLVHWEGWGRGWIEPAGLDLAVTFTAIYWVIAITLGSLWHWRYRIGPAEWLYRKIGG